RAAPTGRVGTLGYSVEERVDTHSGGDNTAMTMTSIPRGTIAGDTWTYDSESRMGGRDVKHRFVIEQRSPEAYAFRWEVQGEGGAWNTILEGKSTRTK